MDVESIKEIGLVIQSLGAEGKTAFMWYLAYCFANTVFQVLGAAFIVWLVCRQIARGLTAVARVRAEDNS